MKRLFFLGMITLATPALANHVATFTKDVQTEHFERHLPGGKVENYNLIYTSSITTTWDEYKQHPRRHCRWSYADYKLTRHLTLQNAKGAYQVIDVGTWTHAPTAQNGETESPCTSVYQVVITPAVESVNTADAWRDTIEADRKAIGQKFHHPLSVRASH